MRSTPVSQPTLLQRSAFPVICTCVTSPGRQHAHLCGCHGGSLPLLGGAAKETLHLSPTQLRKGRPGQESAPLVLNTVFSSNTLPRNPRAGQVLEAARTTLEPQETGRGSPGTIRAHQALWSLLTAERATLLPLLWAQLRARDWEKHQAERGE